MKYIFLYLIFNFSVFANNPENISNYKNKIKLAELYAYNFEFEKCFELLSKAIKIKPDYPEAYELFAETYLWFYLGNKNEEDLNKFFSYADSSLIKAKKISDLYPEDIFYKYIQGNIYKFKAIANGTAYNSLDAFWATKSAVSIYEEILESDPHFYSALGGIGIFEYSLSFVPSFFNWALILSGLKADKESGFNKVVKSAKKATFDIYEYQFHAARLYSEYLAKYDESIKILNELIEKFPKNSLLHYQKAIEYIKKRDLKNAQNHLSIVLKLNHPKFNLTNAYSEMLMGDIYFQENQFEKASEHYLNFLTTTNNIDYTGIASYRLALCFYFMGNDREFKRYLLLASNGNHDLEDDNFAFQMSQKFLEHPIAEEDEKIIKIENLYLSGKNNELIKYYYEEIDSLQSDQLTAEALIYLSLSQISKNEYDEALNNINKILDLEYNHDSWITPMYYFILGKINYVHGNFEMVRDNLIEARKNNNFQKKGIIDSYINSLNYDLSKLK